MFDHSLTNETMLAIGYVRQSNFIYKDPLSSAKVEYFIYKAAWSSRDVEHFIYFKIDSRGYLEADCGLRNPAAEEFGVDSLIKYGHPNARMIRQWRDSLTACSLSFEFARIDNFKGTLWPRFRVAGMPGSKLAQFVTDFISDHIFPIIKPILTLNDLFDFASTDAEPHPWFVDNSAIKAAIIIAIGTQLKLSRGRLRELLIPHDPFVAAALSETQLDPKTCVDRYVDHVLSDWASLNMDGQSIPIISSGE
jgi:hypothetical protein